MAISTKAPNFELSEFASKSDVPLTNAMREHATWHAEQLQRVRDALNSFYMPPSGGGQWQVHVTSFVRSRDTRSDHSTGAGIDWNVRDPSGARHDDLTRWARDWLALNAPDSFAVLIYEPSFSAEGGYAHVHHARRGFSKNEAQNVQPQFLDEVEEGVFKVASIFPFPAPSGPVSLGLLLLVTLGALFVFRRGA